MLFRKLWRTMGLYKAQFISMIIMVALGVGVFVGFNMEWLSIEKNTDKFFAETGFADYRAVSTSPYGFSEEDADKIAAIPEVEKSGRYICENVSVEQTGNAVALTVTENPEVSYFYLVSGEKYDATSEDKVWLSDKFADKNSFKPGDEITLSYSGKKFTGTVAGLIKSGEHMICVSDSTQIMPDYERFGFAYVSPAFYKKAMGGFAVYNRINIISSADKAAISDKINSALSKNVLLLTKNEVMSYAGAQSEKEEGQTMSSVIPVLFLLIAVLTMVTTMHRLTAKEKTQIGTLKALGFKDKTITLHYSSYALTIGLLGCIGGIAIGFGIGAFLFAPTAMMGTYLDMPYWKLYTPWYCWVALAALVVALTFIGWLSVKQMLKGTAADALRPYVPKKMKKLAIEKTRLWKRLSFGTKWNIRDVMRHKARTLMSLFGIVGCVLILVASLGMNDTMQAFLDDYYNTAMLYETRINLVDSTTNDKALELAEKFDGDWSASVGVEMSEKTVSLDIYSVSHGYVSFPAEKNGTAELPDDGALICRRLSEQFNLKKGDKFKLKRYGTDLEYELTVADVIRSTSENIVISPAYAQAKGITYLISSVYTSEKNGAVISREAIVKNYQNKNELMKSFDTFVQMLRMSVTVLISAAVVLGLIVLYNLGVMSYTERYREMATLKVVGFNDKKIGRLLISQNLWVTLIGAILGVPAGAFTLAYLLKVLASEYEMRAVISVWTVLASVAITFLVSLLVSVLVARKNKKIDMVEALKGAE